MRAQACLATPQSLHCELRARREELLRDDSVDEHERMDGGRVAVRETG